MRVLLVGGRGFLGCALSTSLVSHGFEVFHASRQASVDMLLDVRDFERCKQVLSDGKFDVVVNLAGAAISRPEMSLTDASTNILGSVNLLSAAILDVGEPPKVVHIASSTEEPSQSGIFESSYAASKAEGTSRFLDLASKHGGRAHVIYVHNTYGPGQPPERFVMSTMKSIKEGSVPSIRYPNRIRDFIYIDDVAYHLTRVIADRSEGILCSVIGSAVGTSLWDLMKRVAHQAGVEVPVSSHSADEKEDLFRVRVADAQCSHFLQCRTSLSEGVEKTLDALR